MTPSYVVWPDGQPDKAVFAYSWLGQQWRAFRLGWPKPWKLFGLYRVNTVNYHWLYDAQQTPKQIAKHWQGVINYARKAKS